MYKRLKTKIIVFQSFRYFRKQYSKFDKLSQKNLVNLK